MNEEVERWFKAAEDRPQEGERRITSGHGRRNIHPGSWSRSAGPSGGLEMNEN